MIPLHIYQDGWAWKASHEPKVVDGQVKSTATVPLSLVEDLIDAVEKQLDFYELPETWDYTDAKARIQEDQKCLAGN
jgi:hypothetical protein